MSFRFSLFSWMFGSAVLVSNQAMAGANFSLISADTDKVVQSGIVAGKEVYLGGMGAFNFDVTFENLKYDRVRFTTSTGYDQIERTAPHALCGDKKGDFYDCSTVSGLESDFSLTVQAYLANTPVGEPSTIVVYATSEPVPEPEPVSNAFFTLIDSDSDIAIKNDIASGSEVLLSGSQSFNFSVEFKDLVYSKVVFSSSNGHSQQESNAPYTACGDASGDFYDCATIAGFESDFTLIAQAYDGSVPVGSPASIGVKIEDSIVAMPDPIPEPDPVPETPLVNANFGLIDAYSDQIKSTANNGGQVSVSEGMQYNLMVEFPDLSGYDSVKLTTTNGHISTEGRKPYALCGDKSGDYFDCSILSGFDSSFTLTAQAMSGGSPVGEPASISVILEQVGSVIEPPVISYVSSNQVVSAGSNVTLNVQAIGSELRTYCLNI